MNIREQLLRRTIPFFINSFNQHTYLKNLLSKFYEFGFRNIIVVDNASTYPPLLTYYEKLVGQYNDSVLLLQYEENLGPHYFHKNEIFRIMGNIPHIYTDPDLDIDELDDDFVTTLLDLTRKYSMFKVGPALEVPDEKSVNQGIFQMFEGKKYSVREWEKRFWERQIEPDVYYPGHIDTTLHLFNPEYYKSGEPLIDGFRVARKGFTMRHLPWYAKSVVPSEEMEFYKSRSKYSSWS